MIVTAFTSGLPCTFYGFISADAVIDFGPVEALVYWDPRTWRIHAPGILWPLRPADRLLGPARSAVHAVARTLRNQLGYIGAFGTDGVLTEDGYAIHEINPRVCAGIQPSRPAPAGSGTTCSLRSRAARTVGGFHGARHAFDDSPTWPWPSSCACMPVVGRGR